MVNIVLTAAAAATFASRTYDFVIVGGGTAGLAVATRQDYTLKFASICC